MRLTISWPSGHKDSIENITPNQTITVQEGKGIVAAHAVVYSKGEALGLRCANSRSLHCASLRSGVDTSVWGEDALIRKRNFDPDAPFSANEWSSLRTRCWPLDLVPKLTCHPDRSEPGFPAPQHWTRPRVRLSVRERRMKCADATKFNRRSGGAQWTDLLFSQPLCDPRWSHHPPFVIPTGA